jgi:hypothetical protein
VECYLGVDVSPDLQGDDQNEANER